MFSEDKSSKTVDTLFVDKSGVTYTVSEYHTPEGQFRQLRVDLKGEGGVVLESGTILSAEMALRLAKNEKVSMVGGRKQIPKQLYGYFKPEVSGSGTLLLNPTSKYINLVPVTKKMGLVIEQGTFLACDTPYRVGMDDGGFEILTSWNKNLRNKLEGYRDLTTTVVKGKGVLVLETAVPIDRLVQYDITTPVRVNEDAVVMRTIGLERVEMSNEDAEYFTNYSGVEGRGVVYQGRGKMWLYPGSALPTKPDRLSHKILDSFNIVEEVEVVEDVKKRKSNILDRRR